ncbi:NupC/NupG family nucleoside CNT transporter [Caldithrix abyssi]|uniref:Concentrative nucleoside transporter, CNT family n=1 Tax=Caldithrix abyssi DSM 13497 TaxID=880073 RepID=H1XU16_CALAY|nr:nucleoside transporter C-terminal domain-containing protein [Caldithrix abyssi]APF16892.1 concentrative nucleoside transporter, CNT family [Caldithrix abyssi DSM 13497]EHO40459.1 Na+ dependent nucleoside transporter domain protein [Caldithrix abyssi DSM 13497]
MLSTIYDILFGFFGLASLIGIAFLFSADRKHIIWKQVILGILLQIVFAMFVLLTPWGASVFNWIGHFFVKIISFTNEGSRFVFGVLADHSTFEQAFPAELTAKGVGFIFAFQVLPTIIFFSSLMSVLYYLGVMQKIVQAMAWVMAKTLNVSGAESISVAANVFIGQTEAPLVVRPYVDPMTKSELLTLMIGGMATIAGGVLAAYVGVLGGSDPAQQLFYAKHLLSASIMAAPATIVISKILMPEREESVTMGNVKVPIERTSVNVIEAAATGAADGLKLALNVAGMLLAFIALIAMVNWILKGVFTDMLGLTVQGGQPVSLELVLGYLLSPIAWIIGVPWQDAINVGSLIGEKVVLNEFIAYLHLSKLIPQQVLSEKAIIISTYALCGFANFSSIAIQIGGIGGIAPRRVSDLAKFGMKAVLGGTLATFMTATIAGVLISL